LPDADQAKTGLPRLRVAGRRRTLIGKYGGAGKATKAAPALLPLASAGTVDRGKAFAAMGAGHAMDQSDARRPAMHKTNTVDYALVLAGEIWALMDEGETLLKAGDCLIQRGTNHAWSNRTDTPCRVAFILVNAHPV
jgi:mannose-6-phosphate isomerase-like protein (cupin superfamily)